ncbi:MAG: PilN domain-containing protein [Fimbriimonadaceae bacterium]
MSRHALPHRVLEWSPRAVRCVDEATRTSQVFPSAAAAAQALGGGPVVLALSRRNSFLRTVKLPAAPRPELRRLLEFQSESIFPMPVSDLAFDLQPTEETGPDGRTTVVAATPSNELKRAFDEVQAAGFRIAKVVPTAMASPLVAEGSGLRTAIVVEDTPEGLALDVVVDGEIRASRVAPTGSDLGAELGRTAAMLNLSDPQVLLTNGLMPAAGQMKATLTPLEALAGPGATRIEVDLEPREIVLARERRVRARLKRFAALIGASAVLLAVLVALDYSDAQSAVDRARSNMNASVTRLTNIKRSIESDVARESRNLEALKRAFDVAQPLPDVVKLVSDEVPDGLWLTGITLERGRPLVLRGTAVRSDAVAEYLERLNRTERLRDVRLVFSNNATIEATPVVQFSINAFPIGNLPLLETERRSR